MMRRMGFCCGNRLPFLAAPSSVTQGEAPFTQPNSARSRLKPLPQTSVHGRPVSSSTSASPEIQKPVTACRSRQSRRRPPVSRGHSTPAIPRPRGHQRYRPDAIIRIAQLAASSTSQLPALPIISWLWTVLTSAMMRASGLRLPTTAPSAATNVSRTPPPSGRSTRTIAASPARSGKR